MSAKFLLAMSASVLKNFVFLTYRTSKKVVLDCFYIHFNLPRKNLNVFFKFRGHTPLYSSSVSNMYFKETSLPPTPNWDRFDLHATVLFVLLMDY